jgi:hypothetical protein
LSGAFSLKQSIKNAAFSQMRGKDELKSAKIRQNICFAQIFLDGKVANQV